MNLSEVYELGVEEGRRRERAESRRLAGWLGTAAQWLRSLDGNDQSAREWMATELFKHGAIVEE